MSNHIPIFQKFTNIFFYCFTRFNACEIFSASPESINAIIFSILALFVKLFVRYFSYCSSISWFAFSNWFCVSRRICSFCSISFCFFSINGIYLFSICSMSSGFLSESNSSSFIFFCLEISPIRSLMSEIFSS